MLIPDGARLTLCVSTQVGCAMGCGFCATATLGFRRHLSRGEIVEQLLLARAMVAADGEERRITNIVFMGMGEPLHNYDGTVGAIETLDGFLGRGLLAPPHHRLDGRSRPRDAAPARATPASTSRSP